MGVSERTLEEDEAKIDNILHKILKLNEKIEFLSKQADEASEKKFVRERMRMINIMTQTVHNLAWLADDIELKDMELTKELETKIKDRLRSAITNINKATEMFGKEEGNI